MLDHSGALPATLGDKLKHGSLPVFFLAIFHCQHQEQATFVFLDALPWRAILTSQPCRLWASRQELANVLHGL